MNVEVSEAKIILDCCVEYSLHAFCCPIMWLWFVAILIKCRCWKCGMAVHGRVSEPEWWCIPEAPSKVRAWREAKKALGRAASARPAFITEATSAEHSNARRAEPDTGTWLFSAFNWPRFWIFLYWILLHCVATLWQLQFLFPVFSNTFLYKVGHLRHF